MQSSNEIHPDNNENRKKNFFDQSSSHHDDYNQIGDETISKDFLPSGPADLATLESTKVQKSDLLSKRYIEIHAKTKHIHGLIHHSHFS